MTQVETVQIAELGRINRLLALIAPALVVSPSNELLSQCRDGLTAYRSFLQSHYPVIQSERDKAQAEAKALREKVGELAQDWRKEAAESRRVQGSARDSYSQTAGVLDSCADQLTNALAPASAPPGAAE